MGTPLSWPGGGVPCQGGGGYPTWVPPRQGTPILAPGRYAAGGTLSRGYPTWVPPILTWPEGYPARGVPYLGTPWQGTPHPDLAGYPLGYCPMEFWVMLQSIMGYGYPPVSTPWHSGKCCKALWDMGTPPGVYPIAFWEMLQSIMGYGYPPCGPDRLMDGRTDTCQNITFPSYYVGER